MSKLEINNAIVLLRTLVRVAKVCLARKWIRKAEIIIKKKGDEAGLKKNKRMNERLLNQVKAIKKIQDDKVTKFALTNTRQKDEILCDQSLDIEHRTTALLAFFPKFQTEIEKFKTKYPNYLEHLYSVKSKSKKDKSNKLNNLRENKQTKKKQVKLRTDTNSGTEDTDSSSSEDVKKFNMKPDEIRQLEPVQSSHEESENSEEEADFLKKSKKKKSKKKKEELVELTKEVNEEAIKKSSKSKNKEQRKRKISENENEKMIQKEKKHKKKKAKKNLSFESDKLKEEETDEEEEVESQRVEKEVDPFFISDNSAAYMKVKIPKSYEADEIQNFQGNKNFDKYKSKCLKSDERQSSSKPESEINKRLTNHKWNNNKNLKFSKDKFGNTFKGKEFSPKQNFSRDFNTKKQNFSKKQDLSKKQEFTKKQDFSKQMLPKSQPEQQNLHPSWAAKKKQQNIMKSGFQGKKIVFGD